MEKARVEFCRAFKKNPRDFRLLEFLAEARAAGKELACAEEQKWEEPVRAYALIIGIGQYQDRGITELTHPVDDALCIDAALRNPRYSLFHSENIVILLDRQATASAIQRELQKIGEKAGDLAMIYFAGHVAWGKEDAYWLTHDTRLDRIPETGLSNSVIIDFLTRIQARRLTVFVDSYRSTTAFRGKSKLNDFFSTGDNREKVFIKASTEARPSRKLKAIKHGIFSPYLCEVLQGKGDDNRDGLIDIHEALSYIKNRADQTGRDQAPVIRGSYTKEFIISKNPLMKR